jgi:hypothetical protein
LTRITPIAVVTIGLLLAATLSLRSGRSDEPPARPPSVVRYNSKGELLRPEGYRSWVFVGADLGLDYSQRNDQALDYPQRKDEKADDVRPFHNIYVDRAAYEHYARAGEFPDKTMLVLELFESRRKEPRNVVTRGLYEGNRVALEVAVKDRQRPDGAKTPWAYYDFTGQPGPKGRDLRQSAKAKPDESCYDCHKQHADVDNVWVQFYPTLRDLTNPGAR